VKQPEYRYQWTIRNLRDQIRGIIKTLDTLNDRVTDLKAKLVHHVDQGEGLTQSELLEVYAEIDRLFPRRDRRTSEALDVPS
jgi:hypothetical protein